MTPAETVTWIQNEYRRPTRDVMAQAYGNVLLAHGDKPWGFYELAPLHREMHKRWPKDSVDLMIRTAKRRAAMAAAHLARTA